MIRTYRYRLSPNRKQKEVLGQWLERCRTLYNVALEQRREWYRMARKSLGYNQQTKELTELRKEDPSWEAVPVVVARSALKTLDRAYQAFFRRVKKGETPGYPRFKGRGRFDSFGIGKVSVEGKKVRIPILGLVKFMRYRDLGGPILDVRVCLKTGKWMVCFSCDLGEAPKKKAVASTVGLDLGLKAFAVFSDGKMVENPRYFRKAEELLATRQRKLSRKKLGSSGRAKARLLVAKAHEHVKNQRLDFARKLAVWIYEKYDLVSYEDLNIKALSRSVLAKSVQDAAWGMFIRTLISKAECAGKWAVPVDPRGTTKHCSACGVDVEKTMAERTHRCVCGLILDRDENAARNIHALGRSAAVVAGLSLN